MHQRPKPDTGDFALGNRSRSRAETSKHPITQLLLEHGPAIQRSLRVPPASQSRISAEDVMQETYVKAFVHRDEYLAHGPGSFRAWLRTMARNKLVDLLRGEGRRSGVNGPANPHSGDLDAGEVELACEKTPSVGAELAERELHEALRSAVHLLPLRYRDVIQAYYFDARTTRSLAAEMGQTPDCVTALRMRALRRLRRNFVGSRPLSDVVLLW